MYLAEPIWYMLEWHCQYNLCMIFLSNMVITFKLLCFIYGRVISSLKSKHKLQVVSPSKRTLYLILLTTSHHLATRRCSVQNIQTLAPSPFIYRLLMSSNNIRWWVDYDWSCWKLLANWIDSGQIIGSKMPSLWQCNSTFLQLFDRRERAIWIFLLKSPFGWWWVSLVWDSAGKCLRLMN